MMSPVSSTDPTVTTDPTVSTDPATDPTVTSGPTADPSTGPVVVTDPSPLDRSAPGPRPSGASPSDASPYTPSPIDPAVLDSAALGPAAFEQAAPAPLPVSALLPGPPHPPGILAACDGSDGSLWALDRAMTEAEQFALPLYVLAVVDPAPGGYPPGMAELVQGSVTRLSESMADGLRRAVAAVERARGRPFEGPLSLHVLLGQVIEVLLAGTVGQHTLVVGTRGNGGFTCLLLGSVSTAAVHHAACPVLVVPAPAARR